LWSGRSKPASSHKNEEDVDKDKTEEESETQCGIFKVVQAINV
jgi:hypothetical protein